MNNKECESEDCVKPALRGRKFCDEHQGLQELADEINIGQALGVPFTEVRDKLSAGYKSPWTDETVHVYFIQPEGEDVVKISQTDSVPYRVATLQTGNHRELKVLGTMLLPVGFEAKFHAALKDHSKAGRCGTSNKH